jgi:hypothetical protein
MKTKITLSLDKELLGHAKTIAVQQGISLDALMTEQLQKLVAKETDYARARKRALARLKRGMNLNWSPPASRDEIYERKSAKDK